MVPGIMGNSVRTESARCQYTVTGWDIEVCVATSIVSVAHCNCQCSTVADMHSYELARETLNPQPQPKPKTDTRVRLAGLGPSPERAQRQIGDGAATYCTIKFTTTFAGQPALQPLSQAYTLIPSNWDTTAANATLMYKIKWGQVAVEPREGVLTPKGRQLRGHPFQYHQMLPSTETYNMSFFPSAICLWNDVPEEATQAPSPQPFKTSVEAWRRDSQAH